MGKHGALLKNERLKLYKKPSTWILMGVIVTLTLLSLVLSQLFASSNNYYNATWQEQYAGQLEYNTMELKNNPDELYLQSNIEKLRYLLDNKIPPTDWRTDVAAEYFNLKYNIESTKNSPGKGISVDPFGNIVSRSEIPQNTNNTVDNTERLNTLKSILDQNDWQFYVRQKIADLENGTTPSANEQEKKVDIEIYNLYLEQGIVPISTSADFYGNNTANEKSDTWKSSEVQAIRVNKLYLVRGETSQGALLTYTQRAACQTAIDVALERLSTNTPPIVYNSFLGLLESSSSSLSLLSLLLIVFAGGIISTEYSTGTVKLLLITPHKRQKIFWAKTMLLVEISAITLAAIYMLSFLISGAFTGFKGLGDMQVMSLFGSIVRFPYMVYILMRYLLLMLPVLTYGALALMMSAITQKNAIAIAITLLLMFGSEMVMGILAMFSSRMVIPGVKFLLFANTSLQNYLPSASSSMNMDMMNLTVDSTMTLSFSVVVLLAYLICFLWIARDSFCRRDVK